MRRALFATLLLVMSSVLAGCATQAQTRAASIRDQSNRTGAEYRACYQAVYESPSFEPLRRRFPMTGNATLEQMTDKSPATDVEVALILETHPQYQACRQTFLNQLSQFAPTLVPIFAASFNRSESSLIDLIERKKTWGEHVRSVMDYQPQFQAQFSAEQQRIEAGLAQEHQNELASRQAASQALLRYSQTQQLINTLNRPLTTNCTRIGNTVNCFTQ